MVRESPPLRTHAATMMPINRDRPAVGFNA
jgi:hypothetical protein